MQLALPNFLPGALRVLFSATHTGCEIFKAVHVQSAASVTGRENTLTLPQTFHPMDHLRFERTAIVLLCRLTRALASGWEKIGWRIWDRHRRVHHRLKLSFVELRWSHVAGRRWWRLCLCRLRRSSRSVGDWGGGVGQRVRSDRLSSSVWHAINGL